ncbi:hypothetical protein [Pseudomonas sp. NPDC089569]|uniref:hypothetical protein n=1 Tax=Pseudomonas sp. NPDC089569 TaxID=3390722 RepID=UPI003D093CFD
MNSNVVKVTLVAAALLLSACSGVGTHRCDSPECQPSSGFGPVTGNNPNKLNFHGSALGSSYGEYSSGLLHDD